MATPFDAELLAPPRLDGVLPPSRHDQPDDTLVFIVTIVSWLLFRGIPKLIPPIVLSTVSVIVAAVWFCKPFGSDVALRLADVAGWEAPPIDAVLTFVYSLSVLVIVGWLREKVTAVQRTLRKARAVALAFVLPLSILILPFTTLWLATPISFPIKLYGETRGGDPPLVSSDALAVLLHALALICIAEGFRTRPEEEDDADDWNAAPVRATLSAIGSDSAEATPQETDHDFAELLHGHFAVARLAHEYVAERSGYWRLATDFYGLRPPRFTELVKRVDGNEYSDHWRFHDTRALDGDTTVRRNRLKALVEKLARRFVAGERDLHHTDVEYDDRIFAWALEVVWRVAGEAEPDVLSWRYVEKATEQYRYLLSDGTHPVQVNGGEAAVFPLLFLSKLLDTRHIVDRLNNRVPRTWPCMRHVLGAHPALSITGRYLEYCGADEEEWSDAFSAGQIANDTAAVALFRDKPDALVVVLSAYLRLLAVMPARGADEMRESFITETSAAIAFARQGAALDRLEQLVVMFPPGPVHRPPVSAAARFQNFLATADDLVRQLRWVNAECFAGPESLLFYKDEAVPNYWREVKKHIPVIYRGDAGDLFDALGMKRENDRDPKGLIPRNWLAHRFEHLSWFVAAAIVWSTRARLRAISRPIGARRASLWMLWTKMRTEGPFACVLAAASAYGADRYAHVRGGSLHVSSTLTHAFRGTLFARHPVARWWYERRLRRIARSNQGSVPAVVALGIAMFIRRDYEKLTDATECFWLARAYAEAILRDDARKKDHDEARQFVALCDLYLYRVTLMGDRAYSYYFRPDDPLWRALVVMASDMSWTMSNTRIEFIYLRVPMDYHSRIDRLREALWSSPGDMVFRRELEMLVDELHHVEWFAARTRGYQKYSAVAAGYRSSAENLFKEVRARQVP